MDMDHYEITLDWSDQDQPFVADVPDLPSSIAHDAIREEAPANAKETVALWMEMELARVDSAPAPRGRQLMFA